MRRVLLSCEHGGNDIPRRYRALFRGADDVLASHRGWDPGALALAKRLARRLDAPLVFATTSRLLIDLNRSLGHPRQLSSFTSGLTEAEKRALIADVYLPYRQRFEGLVAEHARRGAVLHLSVHTFTPVLDGVVRAVELGLLYDPARARERSFAAAWARALAGALPDLRVRRNAPYRGATDGFTTQLRRRYDERRYLGIELELNQALAVKPAVVRRVADALARTLAALP